MYLQVKWQIFKFVIIIFVYSFLPSTVASSRMVHEPDNTVRQVPVSKGETRETEVEGWCGVDGLKVDLTVVRFSGLVEVQWRPLRKKWTEEEIKLFNHVP